MMAVNPVTKEGAQTADEILDRFATEERTPVLDEEDVATVMGALSERRMVPALSILMGGQQNRSEALLGCDPQSRILLRRHPEAVIGPYVLAGEYNPGGISIYRQERVADAPPTVEPQAVPAL